MPGDEECLLIKKSIQDDARKVQGNYSFHFEKDVGNPSLENSLVRRMEQRSDVLFELVNYLLTPTFGVTIDTAFKKLSHYPKIGGLSILNGKCEKEKNFGTELYAKIKPKHP